MVRVAATTPLRMVRPVLQQIVLLCANSDVRQLNFREKGQQRIPSSVLHSKHTRKMTWVRYCDSVEVVSVS